MREGRRELSAAPHDETPPPTDVAESRAEPYCRLCARQAESGPKPPAREEPLDSEDRPEATLGEDPSKRDAFEEEALVHLDALYGRALRLTGGNEARSQDLVQETVLKAWRAWDTYESGTNCKAWLLTILRNTFINEFRRKKSRPDPVDFDDVEERPVWSQLKEEDPAGEFFDRIIDDEIVEAIEALPDGFRVTLVLSDVEGLSYQEISEELGIPVGTVKSRLYRARRRLQRELYEYAKSMGYVRGPADA